MAKQKSDLSRAFSEDGALKTHVGGQALIEGVMMRGKYNWAVGVREPDGGIYEESHDLASGQKKNGWMYWPLVRGCRAMVESLILGYKALEIAAMHAYSEEELSGEAEGSKASKDSSSTPRSAAQNPTDSSCAPLFHALDENNNKNSVQRVDEESFEPTSPTPRSADRAVGEAPSESTSAETFSWKDDFGRPDTVIDALGAQRTLEVVSEDAACGEGASSVAKPSSDEEEGVFGKREMAISMVLGLVLGVVLFIVAPAFITNLIVGEYDSNTLLWNIVDGVLRVAVFVFYIWLIGRMSDIKRMFGYHGAEHKTIHCYEHGLPLTPENARQFPRLHVRCGTAFLIMVMIIAILVYTITPLNGLIAALGVPDGAPKLVLVILTRIVLMPVIAGISYEITVRWAGSHPENPLVKVVLWPGMQMQYLTTNEPDDSMLECAIAAMQQVLEREELEAAKATGVADA